jgi:hypothetical protein
MRGIGRHPDCAALRNLVHARGLTMRTSDDTKTLDILGESCDLAGPVPAKPTARDLAKARAAKFKERHGVASLTVNIPASLLNAFNEHCAAKGKSKSVVIAKLIESQLLRKR